VTTGAILLVGQQEVSNLGEEIRGSDAVRRWTAITGTNEETLHLDAALEVSGDGVEACPLLSVEELQPSHR